MRPTKSSQVLIKLHKFNFGSQNDLWPSHSAGELQGSFSNYGMHAHAFH